MSSRPKAAVPDDGSEPYVGLKPYTEAERDRFFGRERDAQLLINKLFSHPLTLLYAPSGVGKTSLLRALVVPELAAEEAQVVYVDRWCGADPCATVSEAVATVDRALGAAQLTEAAKARLQADGRTLVLILDQFEEYLQRHAGELGQLPAAIGALLRASLDVRVVLSFREEFLASVDACLRDHVLSLFASTFHLEHLNKEQAAEAIRAPVLKCGGTCDELLVSQLLDDLMPGDGPRAGRRLFDGGIELPILQLICRRLWSVARAAGVRGLRLQDYRALGGRGGIISVYLEEVVGNFGFFLFHDAAKVLKALAPRSGVKIAYPVEALQAQARVRAARVRRVLGVLERHRIVRTREGSGGVSYELQHDAFIDIIRPWLDRYFLRRRRFLGGLAACVLVLGFGVNAWLWRQELRRGDARREAAELTDRIDVDTRQTLEAALALARRVDDRNVRSTLRLAVANFLQSPALLPHQGAANGVAFSRDGRWVLSAGDDGEAHLVNRRSLAVAARVKHGGPVVAVAASADGRRFLSAGRDGVLRVWDETGRDLMRCGGDGGAPWVDADLSRDGARAVGIREDGKGGAELLLVPVAEPCAMTRLSGHFGNVGSAVFDEGGGRVLSFGNNDNTARLWNAATGTLQATLTHPDEVLSASFSSDGSEVAVAVANGEIYRWTARGHVIGRPLEIPVPAGQPPVLPTAARHSPDGRRLAVAGSDGQIYLWTLGEGEAPPPKPPLHLDGIHAGGALGVAFSTDGTRLVSFGVDDTVRVWDDPFEFRAREFRGHSQGVRAAVFAPDGQHLASAGADGAVRLWRLQDLDFLTPAGNGLILSSAGKYSFRLASGQLFETSLPEQLRDLLSKGESVRSAIFSRDESLLALGLTDGRLRLIRSADGRTLFESDDGDGPIFALAFDQGGRRLASGGSDGRLRRYEIRALRADHSGIPAHAGPVMSVDISPDGTLLVSTGADGAARVWAWNGGKTPLSTLEGETDRVRDARFSADGRRIIKRNGDRITPFDGEAWARSDQELTGFALKLLDTGAP